MITGLTLSLLLAVAPPSADAARCRLTAADKQANARLSFNDFDQQGTLPSSARKLGEAGCWKEAAEATADYLIHGPIPSPGEQRVLLFHLGQQLAFAGEEERAAGFIAATRRPPDPMPPKTDQLNWNDYVIGTWAFLKKDRPALIAARDAVLATAGEGNRINGALLAAMERCFEKPYELAYDPDCGR